MKQQCNEITELHNNDTREKKIMECTICKKKYRRRKLLEKHELTHREGQQSCKDNNKKTLFCKVCGQKFHFHKSLLKHEARHVGDGGFWCRSCGHCFNSAEARGTHFEEQHKILKCRICSIVFPLETEYLHHINTLHNGRDREMYMCSDCGKQYRSKGELKHHISSKCGTIRQYKCQICDQTLMTAGSLHNHMLRHNGDPSFMCRYCAKMFLTVGQLTVHERIHTRDKVFVCETCGKGFCHRQSLITHQTLHTGIKPYQCEGCGRAFSCVGNLLKHRKVHLDTCGLIPLTTHRVENPSTRLKVHANTPPNSKLKTKEKLDRIKEKLASISNTLSTQSAAQHFNEIVPENANINLSTEQKNEHVEHYLTPVFIVSNDDKMQNNSLSPTNLEVNLSINARLNASLEISSEVNSRSPTIEVETDENHLEVEPDIFSMNNMDSDLSNDSIDLLTRVNNMQKSKVKTTKPRKKLGSKPVRSKKKRKLVKHKTDENQEEIVKKEASKDKNRLQCQFCPRIFIKANCLLRHEKEHSHGEDVESTAKSLQIKCSCCKLKFNSKEECNDHQRKDHADLLTCRECDRIFANQPSLKNHRKIFHIGIPRKEYLYICTSCGKQFRQKASLSIHEDSNCGTGPKFPCATCGKMFTSFHVRNSHMRVHQPEKTLLCKYCGKSFHWKGQLKIHERSHTGEKPYKCTECPKAFAYRESLATHSSSHTGLKPHVCKGCGARFSCIGNLVKHRRAYSSRCGILDMKETPTATSEKLQGSVNVAQGTNFVSVSCKTELFEFDPETKHNTLFAEDPLAF